VFRINAEGTLNVLQAAGELSGIRVVVIGSADEYGAAAESDLPLREDAPLRPMTPYGASKVAADFLGLQAWLGDGVETLRVRSFNQIGPGQGDDFLFPSVARRILEAGRAGATELKVGSLDPIRDYTDVRDAVRALRLLVEHGTPGEAYNVCSGKGRSVRDVIESFVTLAGVDVRPVIDPELARPVDVPVLVGDPAKVREATGWEPAIALTDTLADLLTEWKARLGP
jgi:GDP-4-dehydro-6-deoxy-D-mannose reductase